MVTGSHISDRQEALLELLSEVAATGYRFVAPTPETHRRVNARHGNEFAHDLAGVFGWSRPFTPEILGARLCRLLERAGAVEETAGRLKSLVRIATLYGQAYLHSAFPTTAADSVFFGPDTYRFVRAALAELPHRPYARAVDLGCGSGAGGLAIAEARRVDELWLTDINPAALSLARVNAARQGRRPQFAESDLLNALDGQFDLILANPPYLADPGKRAYRDGGGALGLELGLQIVREGSARLSESGTLFVYTGAPISGGVDEFRRGAEQILCGDSFISTYSEIDPDVFGEELDNPAYRNVDRIAAVVLSVNRLGK